MNKYKLYSHQEKSLYPFVDILNDSNLMIKETDEYHPYIIVNEDQLKYLKMAQLIKGTPLPEPDAEMDSAQYRVRYHIKHPNAR